MQKRAFMRTIYLLVLLLSSRITIFAMDNRENIVQTLEGSFLVEYRNYQGEAKFYPSRGVFFGNMLKLNIVFEGKTEAEAKEHFKAQIDEFIAMKARVIAEQTKLNAKRS